MKMILEIPDQIIDRVLNGFAKYHNYNSGDQALGNIISENKEEFLKRKVIEFLKSSVVDQESNEAANIASKEASDLAKDEIVILTP